ncbi:MAG: hypothetical protein H0W11_11110 [Gemmatimonadetes bacterium]|nr:hypothetical protein [Gemmatimonadota bacterium]
MLDRIVVVLFGHAGDPFGRGELPLLFFPCPLGERQGDEESVSVSRRSGG